MKLKESFNNSLTVDAALTSTIRL